MTYLPGAVGSCDLFISIELLTQRGETVAYRGVAFRRLINAWHWITRGDMGAITVDDSARWFVFTDQFIEQLRPSGHRIQTTA